MTNAPPIEVFYWPTPNGWKVTIALEEMGLPYRLRRVEIGQGVPTDAAFLAASPTGKMPAIIDPEGPDGAPISIFESGPILRYLARKSGRLYPNDERQRIAVDQWIAWQAANLGPMSGEAGFFRTIAPAMVTDARELAFATRRYEAETVRLYGVLDRQLEGRDYLLDEFGLADIMVWPGLTRYAVCGQDLNDFENLGLWLRRVAARPGVRAGALAGLDWDPTRRGMSAEAFALVTSVATPGPSR